MQVIDAVRKQPLAVAAGATISAAVDDLLVDLTAELADLLRPVIGQVIFGHPEPPTPATVT